MTPNMSISEREIAILKSKYVSDLIDLDEFEEQVGNWLMWETLHPLARLEFEQRERFSTRRGPG